MSEEPLIEEGAQGHYLQLFRELESRSSVSGMPRAEASRDQEDLLDSRLRDLGYLD